MLRKKKVILFATVFGLVLVCGLLYFFAPKNIAEPVKVSGERQPLYRYQDKDAKFYRVVGWLSNQEVLIHAVYDGDDKLYRFNIRTGENKVIYKSNLSIGTVEIAKNEEKIFVQEVLNKESSLLIINPSGEVLQQNKLPTRNNVYANWNRSTNDDVMITYLLSDGSLKGKVFDWQVSQNKLDEMPFHGSFAPTWYSDHLYVYLEPKAKDATTSDLYLVDKRNEQPQKIAQNVVQYFANGDSFILFNPSDFHEGDLFLNHQYPFMIEKEKTTVPTTLVGKQINVPFLAQSHEQDKIYGVFATESVDLFKKPAKYILGEIDFTQHRIKKICDLPENAPIKISENEHYLLFGWRYEYVIDLKHHNKTDILGLHKK